MKETITDKGFSDSIVVLFLFAKLGVFATLRQFESVKESTEFQ